MLGLDELKAQMVVLAEALPKTLVFQAEIIAQLQTVAGLLEEIRDLLLEQGR